MANKWIEKKVIVTRSKAFVSSFPDVRYIAHEEQNYNNLYGVNWDYYPAPYPGHLGTDYLIGRGNKIYGLDGFKVNHINKQNTYYGYNVEIGNAHIAFIFAHMDSINVKQGQKVDVNTVLGTTGKTGGAYRSQTDYYGAHLHVQAYLAGTGWVDATPYMNGTKAIPGMPTKPKYNYGEFRKDINRDINKDAIGYFRYFTNRGLGKKEDRNINVYPSDKIESIAGDGFFHEVITIGTSGERGAINLDNKFTGHKLKKGTKVVGKMYYLTPLK